MTNFFQSPQIRQQPNPEPPGFDLLRYMMMQRAMQGFNNPYGMSPQGQQSWQGFNQGSRPFNPYSNGMQQGQVANMGQAMPRPMTGTASAGGMQMGQPQQMQNPQMGGIAQLLQQLMMQRGSQPPLDTVQLRPFGGSAMMPPQQPGGESQSTSDLRGQMGTSAYDGTVMGYGGVQPATMYTPGMGGGSANSYSYDGVPQMGRMGPMQPPMGQAGRSPMAPPHLLGLLRMLHTQPSHPTMHRVTPSTPTHMNMGKAAIGRMPG